MRFTIARRVCVRRDQVGRFIGVNRAAFAAAQLIQRPPLGHGGQPSGGVIGQPTFRPYLQGLGEGILQRVFSQVEVAETANQPGQNACALGAANLVDDGCQHVLPNIATQTDDGKGRCLQQFGKTDQ